MLNWGHWLSQGGESINAGERAIAAWSRIQRDAVSVVLVRGGVNLTAQTVRVVVDTGRAQVSEDGMTTAATRTATLFGVRNHPTVANTDVQRGDLLRLSDGLYKVVAVTHRIGEVQATCEAQS